MPPHDSTPPPGAPDALLTKRQAADRLGVSIKTIERRIKAGTLQRRYVHGPHGPEVRVAIAAAPPVVDATFTVAAATPEEGATANGAVAVHGVAPWTEPATLPESEAVRVLLRALDRALDEAHRARLGEAAARAQVESYRRAEAAAQGPFQRLTALFRRRRG